MKIIIKNPYQYTVYPMYYLGSRGTNSKHEGFDKGIDVTLEELFRQTKGKPVIFRKDNEGNIFIDKFSKTEVSIVKKENIKHLPGADG